MMYWGLIVTAALFFPLCDPIDCSQTTISIDGENFYINGKITYDKAKNKNVQGLLLNSRMINAIFNNSATEYNYLFDYPDTHKWDATRNTREFVGNLSLYQSYGLLSFTVGLQGGDPFGYTRNEPNNISGQPWVVSPYGRDTGALNMEYFTRLESILSETDKLGITPIVQMFYPAQVNQMSNDDAIMSAINNTLDWLMSTNYTNFLIEVTNECNAVSNDIAGENGMASTFKYIRNYTNGKYLLGSSLTGGHTPNDDFINAADMILLHGNGQTTEEIVEMINTVKSSDAFKQNGNKPILFNEDDHYDFSNNGHFYNAISNHVSWGIFVDCNKTTAGDYFYGYQCLPAAWDINTPIKQAFFDTVKNYTS